MNPIRLTLLFGSVALLAACATTPEQKSRTRPKHRNVMSRIFKSILPPNAIRKLPR